MKWFPYFMISLPLFCQGQGNLVPNGSFEDIVSCPTGTSQIHLAVPWLNDAGGVELYNVCNPGNPVGNPHVGVPANTTGHQYAHSGIGYAGIFTYGGPFESEGREYLQIELSEPLQHRIYLVSFWASLADKFQYSVTSLGAYFSDTLVTRTTFNSVLNFEPAIENPADQNLSNKDLWYLVSDTFTSRYGGEEYLLIGNFRSTEESNLFWVDSGASQNHNKSYYYIDDVSVVALDTLSSIEETERLQFNVYPNPAIETVSIEGKGRLGHVQLLDIRGRELVTEAANGPRHTLDLSGVPEGIYLLRVTDKEGRTATQRFVRMAGQ